jgi:uncharacterized protein YigA (DUF484 family)
MSPEDIAEYLQQHPDFFVHHADLVSSLTVPHPLSGQAIPLAERQVLDLRQKNRVLESRLGELLQFGEENDAIAARVHRLSVTLLGAASLESVLAVLYAGLRQDFTCPHVALRIWRGQPPGEEGTPVSAELQAYAEGLAHPFCGLNADFEAARWFSAGSEHVRSVAFLALRDDLGTFGLIALGSEDAKRFYPEMGTVYLSRIAALAAAALVRYL